MLKKSKFKKLKILGRNWLSLETKNLCPCVFLEIDNIGFNERNQSTNLIGRYLKRGTVEHLMIFDSELVGSFWTVSVYIRLSCTKNPKRTACLTYACFSFSLRYGSYLQWCKSNYKPKVIDTQVCLNPAYEKEDYSLLDSMLKRK